MNLYDAKLMYVLAWNWIYFNLLGGANVIYWVLLANFSNEHAFLPKKFPCSIDLLMVQYFNRMVHLIRILFNKSAIFR